MKILQEFLFFASHFLNGKNDSRANGVSVLFAALAFLATITSFAETTTPVVTGAPKIANATRWCDDLYLGRGGVWTRRTPIMLSNQTAEAYEGLPVALKVGKDLPIANVRIEELRLVDEKDNELLFGVWGDERIENGPVPDGAELSIPVSLPANGFAVYWLYWNNPSAWGYADFFKERAVLDLNGSFEKGNDETAVGWHPSLADAKHRLSIDTKVFASDKRALRAETDPDAKESWFSFSRHDITVVPGAEVTLRVKVRGENVKGTAGWYIHIGDKKKSDVVNRVVRTGTGTFDWKETVIKVKVPEGCTRLATGSVLRGTGTAWYDDFSFDPGVERPSVFARVGATEQLSATFVGENAAWPADPADGAWEFRVPVRLANFSPEGSPSTLASFNLHEAVRSTRNADCRLMDDSGEIPLCVLNDRVLFTTAIPAQTVKTCWLYVRQGKPRPQEKPEEVRSALGSPIPSDQVLLRKTMISDMAAYEKILTSSANMTKNPCFTDGMTGWRHSNEAKGSRIAYEPSATGGKFGSGFATMSIPADEKAIWRGWYQTIPIKPNRNYFYGGFISSDDADARTTISLHKHDNKGKNTLMTSSSGGIVGTAPWTPTFGTFSTVENDATVTLHLTTHGHGKFAYDGLIVAEYARAQVGDPQARPAGPHVAFAVQAVDPIVKVFRESPVEDSRAFEVCLARNETEPLQLAVRAAKAIGRLEVEVTPPMMADGTGGVSVETGWVEYVPVDYPSSYFSSLTPEWRLKHPKSGTGSDGWSGWWPDPIAPVNAGPIAANVTQPVWINVKSSADTKPGVYEGRIKWKADGLLLREDTYSVRVWNFTLPAVAETPAIYDLRLHSKWWKNDFEGLDTDGRRRLLWKFNSEKRLCPDSLGGQPKFSRAPDGTITADFAEYDRLAAEYFDEFHFPVSYTPGTFYCFGWAMPPRKFLGEDPYPGEWPYEGADRMKLRPEYKRAYQDALRLYWNHMKAKGWADKLVLYISDEPHFTRQEIKTQMIACCQMIHEVDPTIRIYSSTWRHCPEWNDSIDVWGVGHYGCFPVAEMKARAAAGKHVWFTTDGQMCLDTPYCAVERMLPHYCAAFHAEAYEFWGSTWLTYDPWKFGWHSYIPQSDTPGKHYFVRYPDGDGYLIYPGVPGRFKGPVTSVRLEAARDGVEDFSYLKRLERLADGNDPRAERAKALLAEFRALVTIPNAGGRYSTSILPEPEKIGILRRKAGDLLNEAK